MHRSDRRTSVLVALGAAVLTVAASTGVGSAQQPCEIIGDCTPGPGTPRPSVTPGPPLPGPSATPTPSPSAVPSPSGGPAGTPTPTPSAAPGSPLPLPDAAGQPGQLPSGLEGQIEVPILARTPPRNTVDLVAALEPLTEYGVPLEQVLMEGMGRFPVAGLAFYSDDWLHPRYTPQFHLHQGLDIFADFGTPVRAPDDGTILRLSDGGAGGIAVWTQGSDGTQYYFAHLLSRAEGLEVGQRIETGTLLGYVGDSGNARGGTPHLHFEIHQGQALRPKPTVDRWLDEAVAIAPRWVELQIQGLETRRGLVDTGRGAAGSKEMEASMVLTLLDPVAGSVGLIPSLDIEPGGRRLLSERLMRDLIARRLDGFLLVPTSHVGD